MSIFLIFLRFLHYESFAREFSQQQQRQQLFRLSRQTRHPNIKVLCKRINALNARLTAAAVEREGGMKSDRLISCKSSPNSRLGLGLGAGIGIGFALPARTFEHSHTACVARPKKNKQTKATLECA